MVKRLLFSFALQQAFSAPAERGTRTAAGGFAPNGRGGFAEPQRGDSPRPAAGQEGRHQGFYPLNSHFLLGESGADCRHVTAAKIGERQRIFSSVSFAIYSQGRIHYCYTDRLLSAGATYSCCATRKSGDNRRHLRIYAFDTIYLRRNCL